MNEEQRKQRDARVAELAEAAAVAWDPGQGTNHEALQAQIRMRINLALDEQAKEIAAAIQSQIGDGTWGGDYYHRSAIIAASFGDDR